MGTRSLLAVETAKDKLHVQYMQFDGYPSCKGYEYYWAVLTALIEAGACNFVTKSGKPNKRFRDRCKDFLNDYQYKTHHSTGNHWVCSKKDEWYFQKDCWQEFEYMFELDGNFHFDGWGLTYEIPWEVTIGIAKAFTTADLAHGEWDEDAPNIIGRLFEQLDNSEEYPYSLELEVGVVNAFPDHPRGGGFRDYGILKLKNGSKVVDKVQSMFANKKGKKKQGVYKTWQERDVEEPA